MTFFHIKLAGTEVTFDETFDCTELSQDTPVANNVLECRIEKQNFFKALDSGDR